MTRFMAVLAMATIALGLYAASAPGARKAALPRDEQFVVLNRQVRVMQKQVRALRERTTLLRSEVVWTLEMIETAMRDGETCLAALTADAFQSTWSQVDRLAVSLGASPVFGSQATVGDKSSCEGIGVPRATLNPSVPPTAAPFQAFIGWLNGG
jgi:hypothetical protein